MLEISSSQLQIIIANLFWPLCRILAFLLASPLLGHSSIPLHVKIGFAVFLSILVAPTLPTLPEITIFSWAGFGLLIEQMLIGLAIGFIMRVTFTTAQVVGDLIGLQMGLAFATLFTPESGNTMILARLLYMIALLLFISLNGHLVVLEILAGTFQTIPIGQANFSPESWRSISGYVGILFTTGILLALPMIAALLIINLAMGILNRSAPQLTVFSVGFPLTLAIGLFLLMILMKDMGKTLESVFGNGIHFLKQWLDGLILIAN